MEVLNHVNRAVTFKGVHSNGLHIFSQVIGWGYFFAWSLSFYPQVWMNFRRKNVSGLSFDFVTLNITGFFAYTIFNVVLKYDTFVSDLYIAKYGGQIPVETNDVVFAVHAFVMTLVTAAQVLWYPKGTQKVSMVSIVINIILWLGMMLFTWLALAGKFSWLNCIYIFSYVKLIITLIKYIPQAWSNFVRKSTEGWSVGQPLLDIAGGLMSFGQQFVDAINAGDWAIIYGNPVKLGLALISIAFDLLFMTQHYILYRKRHSDEDVESKLETVSLNTSRTTSTGLFDE